MHRYNPLSSCSLMKCQPLTCQPFRTYKCHPLGYNNTFGPLFLFLFHPETKWRINIYFLCLGALRVAVNMEASAANHGAPSTVTAPTRATAEPPVTAVSATTHTHPHTYTPVWVCSMMLVSPQRYTSSPAKPTNTEAGRRGTIWLTWTAAAPSDHSWYTATWQVRDEHLQTLKAPIPAPYSVGPEGKFRQKPELKKCFLSTRG